jgi:hypothetical protein
MRTPSLPFFFSIMIRKSLITNKKEEGDYISKRDLGMLPLNLI